MNEHPEWLFHGKDYPKRSDLHAQRIRVIARHPKTTFICAHMANDGEDLAEVGRWLDLYPNMYVDIDARISELGRQPYSSRRFFLKYQDRIMFGTDTAPKREAYQIYYRFLETDDEYFDPAGGHHPQGFWMIYGVFLPRDVLEKLYVQERRTAAGRPETDHVTAGHRRHRTWTATARLTGFWRWSRSPAGAPVQSRRWPDRRERRDRRNPPAASWRETSGHHGRTNGPSQSAANMMTRFQTVGKRDHPARAAGRATRQRAARSP